MATPASDRDFFSDVAVVGGCGHGGLPLAIAFADRGARVVIYDVSESDLLVIAAPHPQYRDLATTKPVADIWNILGQGVRV
jgi:UDP-N-acetyl-D-mannosaminuronate dehydrogenase